MHMFENMGLSLIMLLICGTGASAALIVTSWKGARLGVICCLCAAGIAALVSFFIVMGWSKVGLIKPAEIPWAYLTVLANDLIVWLTVSAIGLGIGYGVYGMRMGAYKRQP